MRSIARVGRRVQRAVVYAVLGRVPTVDVRREHWRGYGRRRAWDRTGSRTADSGSRQIGGRYLARAGEGDPKRGRFTRVGVYKALRVLMQRWR